MFNITVKKLQQKIKHVFAINETFNSDKENPECASD